MPDPRMDAVLDYLSVVRRVRVRDAWVILYLELLVQELLCSPATSHDQIAREMLSVIRGDEGEDA